VIFIQTTVIFYQRTLRWANYPPISPAGCSRPAERHDSRNEKERRHTWQAARGRLQTSVTGGI